jgi:hypothetical protein
VGRVSVTEAVEFHLPPALEAKLLDLLPDAIEQQEPHIQDQLRAAIRDDPDNLRIRPAFIPPWDPNGDPFVVVVVRAAGGEKAGENLQRDSSDPPGGLGLDRVGDHSNPRLENRKMMTATPISTSRRTIPVRIASL